MTALLSAWATAWFLSPARKHLLVGAKVTRRTLGMTSRPPAVYLARGAWDKGRSTEFAVLSWSRPGGWVLMAFCLTALPQVPPVGIGVDNAHPLQVCRSDHKSKCLAWFLALAFVSRFLEPQFLHREWGSHFPPALLGVSRSVA